MLEKTLNLLEIEPWLSIRQADTFTGVLIVFTVVFYCLFLLISYVNSSTVLKAYLTHTSKFTQAVKHRELPVNRTVVVYTTS